MLWRFLFLLNCISFVDAISSQSNMVNLQKIASSVIPILNNISRKGSHGKVAIVGGSFEYTGAPHYAALSALRTGADLTWIFCSQDSAIPIKSYSPDAIVLPILPSSRNADPSSSSSRDKDRISSSIFEFERLALRFDSVVIGPGLGRNEFTFDALKGILEVCRNQLLPTVIDGDALFFLSTNTDALDLIITNPGWPVVLTPNGIEFKRLWDVVCPLEDIGSRTNKEAVEHFVKCLQGRGSKTSLGSVTVLLKGELDVVSSDGVVETIQLIGSPRRCGGQGDILAGSIGTFLAWAKSGGHIGANASQSMHVAVDDSLVTTPNAVTSACACGGSLVTRHASLLAFSKKRRSTTTPDILNEIGEAFEKAFPL